MIKMAFIMRVSILNGSINIDNSSKLGEAYMKIIFVRVATELV